MVAAAHLSRAPIVEAVLDIWVRPIERAGLAGIAARVSPRFPKVERRQEVQGQFGMTGGTAHASTKVDDIGFLYSSPDGLDLIQARFDGFSVNRLRPYRDWRTLESLAREYWAIYSDQTKPQEVIKLGLRYINQFPLPVVGPKGVITGLDQFLEGTPSASPGSTLESFVSRVVERSVSGASATITLAGIPPAGGTPGDLSVVLDIQTERAGSWGPDAAEIWPVLAELREMKNRLFFSRIKEALKQRFQ